ncbi:MAG: hypothetical protein F4X92_05035, partial [Gammaproteobacteria bacterium]|nr:hypothetical protein [Gammaproteobacteria bacterium]
MSHAEKDPVLDLPGQGPVRELRHALVGRDCPVRTVPEKTPCKKEPARTCIHRPQAGPGRHGKGDEEKTSRLDARGSPVRSEPGMAEEEGEVWRGRGNRGNLPEGLPAQARPDGGIRKGGERMKHPGQEKRAEAVAMLRQ